MAASDKRGWSFPASAVGQSGWQARAKWLVRNPHAWVVAFGLGFVAVLHYVGLSHGHLLNLLLPFLPAPLTRHTLDRVLVVFPVVYAGLMFGIRGGMWTLLAAVAIMVPRALFISERPLDAALETAVVTASGAVLLWMVEVQEKERRLRERRLAEMEGLNSISATAVQSLALKEVLNSSLERIAGVMSTQIAWVYLLDEERKELRFAGHYGFSEKLLRGADRLTVGEGLSGRVVASGEPMALESISRDPRLTREAVKEEGVHGFLTVPLVCKGRIIGTIGVATLTPRLFGPDEIRLLDIIANQVAVVIENARLYESLRESAGNMRFYIRQITRTQEDERLRIARELHDETAQALVLLSRRLDALAAEEGMPQTLMERLEDLRELTDSILEEVRRFSRDLRPSVLNDLGMLPALQGLVTDLMRGAEITGELKVAGEERRLAPETALVLFRITQEAIANVRRHSGATRVLVAVEFGPDKVTVSIVDDGDGFEVPTRLGDLASTGKLGLIGMRERAELLGGSLEVRSSPRKGTTVTVSVPA